MNDTTPTHCGHDPRYIVQADEGTAYCALCELEAAQKELARIKGELTGWLERENVITGGKKCFCSACGLSRKILK